MQNGYADSSASSEPATSPTPHSGPQNMQTIQKDILMALDLLERIKEGKMPVEFAC